MRRRREGIRPAWRASVKSRQCLALVLVVDSDSFVQGVTRCNWQRSATPMAGETDLHKTLKKEACRWLYRMGYRCIAAEVRLRPLGIIDAVGTGVFRPYHNYLYIPRDLLQ